MRFIQTLIECGDLTASTYCNGVLQGRIAVTIKPYIIDEAWGAKRGLAGTVNSMAGNARLSRLAAFPFA